jgi:hypothetical protein
MESISIIGFVDGLAGVTNGTKRSCHSRPRPIKQQSRKTAATTSKVTHKYKQENAKGLDH